MCGRASLPRSCCGSAATTAGAQTPPAPLPATDHHRCCCWSCSAAALPAAPAGARGCCRVQYNPARASGIPAPSWFMPQPPRPPLPHRTVLAGWAGCHNASRAGSRGGAPPGSRPPSQPRHDGGMPSSSSSQQRSFWARGSVDSIRALKIWPMPAVPPALPPRFSAAWRPQGGHSTQQQRSLVRPWPAGTPVRRSGYDSNGRQRGRVTGPSRCFPLPLHLQLLEGLLVVLRIGLPPWRHGAERHESWRVGEDGGWRGGSGLGLGLGLGSHMWIGACPAPAHMQACLPTCS